MHTYLHQATVHLDHPGLKHILESLQLHRVPFLQSQHKTLRVLRKVLLEEYLNGLVDPVRSNTVPPVAEVEFARRKVLREAIIKEHKGPAVGGGGEQQ